MEYLRQLEEKHNRRELLKILRLEKTKLKKELRRQKIVTANLELACKRPSENLSNLNALEKEFELMTNIMDSYRLTGINIADSDDAGLTLQFDPFITSEGPSDEPHRILLLLTKHGYIVRQHNIPLFIPVPELQKKYLGTVTPENRDRLYYLVDDDAGLSYTIDPRFGNHVSAYDRYLEGVLPKDSGDNNFIPDQEDRDRNESSVFPHFENDGLFMVVDKEENLENQTGDTDSWKGMDYSDNTNIGQTDNDREYNAGRSNTSKDQRGVNESDELSMEQSANTDTEETNKECRGKHYRTGKDQNCDKTSKDGNKVTRRDELIKGQKEEKQSSSRSGRLEEDQLSVNEEEEDPEDMSDDAMSDKTSHVEDIYSLFSSVSPHEEKHLENLRDFAQEVMTYLDAYVQRRETMMKIRMNFAARLQSRVVYDLPVRYLHFTIVVSNSLPDLDLQLIYDLRKSVPDTVEGTFLIEKNGVGKSPLRRKWMDKVLAKWKKVLSQQNTYTALCELIPNNHCAVDRSGHHESRTDPDTHQAVASTS